MQGAGGHGRGKQAIGRGSSLVMVLQGGIVISGVGYTVTVWVIGAGV